MQKPNLFIIGAPKSGTTSLSEYLRSHPNIFMCTPKEPHFFSKDLNRYPSIRTIDEYLMLFKNSTESHSIVCESSVWYLFSSLAVDAIYKFNSRSKIIIMLRNPIELIYSLHSYTYNNREDEYDFQRAFYLQKLRAQGFHLPPKIDEPLLLQYTKIGKLGEQVERVLQTFPSDQVKLILFDDFISQTKQVYEDILMFLNVPLDDRIDFPKLNKSTKPRKWLTSTKKMIPFFAINMYRDARCLLGLHDFSISDSIEELTHLFNKKPSIEPSFRCHLEQIFQDDIEKLAKISGRDLSHWVGNNT